MELGYKKRSLLGVGNRHLQMASTAPTLAGYRFGEFEFSAAKNRLRKHGTRLPLERKPALVLFCLLGNAGRVVTREELQRVLWPDNTFVDFELGLRVAVNKLRVALSDSPEHPQYIETVVGEGYRFIAHVTSVEAPAAIVASPVVSPTQGVTAMPPVGRRSRMVLIAWFAAAAGLLLAVVALRPQSRISWSADNWVLVTAFDNRTTDAALDGALKAALERELDNSHFVHVAPPERVQDDLALMRRRADSPIDEAVGRELCLRDGGIKLLLNGRIDRLGSNYVISVSMVDPGTGAALHSASSDARTAEGLPAAIHRIGDDVRAALGEQAAEIHRTDVQFEKVTTPSFEALKLFNIGNAFQAAGEPASAVTPLEQAVQLDPGFASAWTLLGWARMGAHKPGKDALEAFRRGLSLSDQVSERERLFIQHSWYFANNDYDKALQYGLTLVRLYPDHYWAANNLSGLLWDVNRGEAIQMMRECLRLRPSYFLAFDLALAVHSTNPALAEEFSRTGKAIAVKNADPKAEFALGYQDVVEAWWRAHGRAMALALGRLHPVSTNDFYRTAAAFAVLGKLRQAEVVAAGAPEATSILLDLAYLRGGLAGVREFVAQHPPATKPAASDALLLYASGAPDRQRKQALRQAQSIFNSSFYGLWREGLEGELSLQRRDYRLAIRHIEASLAAARHSTQSYPMTAFDLLSDALATSYEAVGDRKAAIAALERLRDDSDGDADPGWAVMWPIRQKHLAKLYRATGDTVHAAMIEKSLASLLVDADPDYAITAKGSENTPAGHANPR
jgi:DNA-binding winged helix-turn-helix (wHTH) protein/tetratricopeptide (TPR) repeat protein